MQGWKCCESQGIGQELNVILGFINETSYEFVLPHPCFTSNVIFNFCHQFGITVISWPPPLCLDYLSCLLGIPHNIFFCHPPSPPPPFVRLAWYSQPRANFGSKNYLKWRETLVAAKESYNSNRTHKFTKLYTIVMICRKLRGILFFYWLIPTLEIHKIICVKILVAVYTLCCSCCFTGHFSVPPTPVQSTHDFDVAVQPKFNGDVQMQPHP